MWARCGPDVDPMWTLFPNSSAANVDPCGPDVDPMWILFPNSSAANVDPCGPDVDPMWTRCGLCFPIVVHQMWTRTPFSIYNNIGGRGGRSTWPHGRHQAVTTTLYWVPVLLNGIVLGARASKCEIVFFFGPPGPTSWKTITSPTVQWAR